jgi:hypothetical protein
MLIKLKTATVVGIEAIEVGVEVDVTGGLPGFHIVGLPNGAVREGAVRISAAIRNTDFKLRSCKITVNLAPADVRKDGAAFDLPIAVGILASKKLMALERGGLLLAGELSMDGRVKPIRGALSLALSARRQGLRGIVLPEANAREAALVAGIDVLGVATLRQAVHLLAGVARHRRDLKGAVWLYEGALRLRRDLPHPPGVARTLLRLGSVMLTLQRRPAGIDSLLQAVGMQEEVGSESAVVLAAATLAAEGEMPAEEAAILLAEATPRLTHLDRMEAEYLLFRATDGSKRRRNARELLRHLVDHAPEEFREAMVKEVPLYQAIG